MAFPFEKLTAGFGSFRDDRTRLALAAVLGEVGEQFVHACELRSVNQVASAGFDTHQACVVQSLQVKRQTTGGDFKLCS
jgi:hypothetical protein